MKYWLELNPITSSQESSTSNFSQFNFTQNSKSGQCNIWFNHDEHISCVQCPVWVWSQVTKRDLTDIITELLTDDMTDTELLSIIFRPHPQLCHNSNIALNDSIAPVSNFLLFFLKRISFKNKNDEAGAGANDKIHLKFPKWIRKTVLHHTQHTPRATLKCKICKR